MNALRRVTFAAAVVLAGSCSSDDPSAPPPVAGVPPPVLGAKTLTVVVAVVDSLMPDEITPTRPNLQALKDGGTFYAESRSVYAAETIPNHVAMMTGVNPRRSGIVANSVFDRALDDDRDLSRPTDLAAKTLFTWIKDRCAAVNPGLRTGATLSKTYLFEIFSAGGLNRAPDSHWDPRDSRAHIGEPSNHTPDPPTMDQALVQLPDADFFFLNLGDVDRGAHAGGQALRSGALAEADAQIGRLVDHLKETGRWDSTVLFLVSDHGMDFSAPTSFINVQGTLDDLAGCGFLEMTAVDVGGTDSIFVNSGTASATDRQAALRAARTCLVGGAAACTDICATAAPPGNATGIASAWYTEDDPADPGGAMPASIASNHPNLGGLSLAAAAGFRFSEPGPQSNPIPGNHGHLPTIRNTMIVSGGSPWVRKGRVIAASSPAGPLDRLPEQSENIDVAPTVAWLLGLGVADAEFPDGQGFDGRVLKEAFTQFDASPEAPTPTVCGTFD